MLQLKLNLASDMQWKHGLAQFLRFNTLQSCPSLVVKRNDVVRAVVSLLSDKIFSKLLKKAKVYCSAMLRM